MDPPDIEAFEQMRTRLTTAIQETTNKHAPTCHITHYSRRWWTPDLKKLRKVVKRLERQSRAKRNNPEDPIHSAFRKTRNEYGHSVERAKKQLFDNYLANLSEATIWSAHQMTSRESTDGSRARVPNLTASDLNGNTRELVTDREKGEALFTDFFAKKATLTWEEEDYPPPKFTFRRITDSQVQEAISRAKSHKCPGTDGITNEVLKQCSDVVTPTLSCLFRASFRLEFMPAAWKNTRTIVLRKPGKPSYKIPKAYRPVEIASCIR
jgi:hypothetical protein